MCTNKTNIIFRSVRLVLFHKRGQRMVWDWAWFTRKAFSSEIRICSRQVYLYKFSLSYHDFTLRLQIQPMPLKGISIPGQPDGGTTVLVTTLTCSKPTLINKPEPAKIKSDYTCPSTKRKPTLKPRETVQKSTCTNSSGWFIRS